MKNPTKKTKTTKTKTKIKMPKNYSYLRFLVDDMYAIQEHRIKSQNRCWALKKVIKMSKSDIEYYEQNIYQKIEHLEKWLEKEILKKLQDHSIYTEWLKNIKGIGPRLAGSIIAIINDIKRFKTISCLWSYAGLGIDDKGQAIKKQKGQNAKWNHRLKTTLWKIGESFVKTKGGYRALYEQSRKYYDAKFPKKVLLVDKDGKPILNKEGKKIYKYNKGHKYAMAKRWTVKIFLAHLFEKWYEIEGLAASKPYIMMKETQHNNYIKPCEK